ncbi:DUF3795 domain-containing protein [Myxococcota bacterium]|nr:DUF3795 domain-containing protein [Myxococcota bacterium]
MPLRIKPRQKLLPGVLAPELIAPCGMDCALCMAFVRDKNGCLGCLAGDEYKPKSCQACSIRNCEVIRSGEANFCSDDCGRFPCPRLKRLDARYRLKYRMSMLENLRAIQDEGVDAFVASERERWVCPECGGLLCVHTPECVYCGHV